MSQPTTPQPTPPATTQNPTDSELHYKSLIELLKYGVQLITTFLTVIAIGLGYITWSNGKDMRDDLNQARENMELKITEMKKNVEDQKKDLEDKQKGLDEAVKIASDKIDLDLKNLRRDAVRQIGNAKNESVNAAITASRNKVEEVFKSNNIEKFITDVAKDKLEPKINKVVEDQISNYDKKADKQKREVQKVQDYYELGQPTAAHMAGIDSISKSSEYVYVRELAKSTLNKLNYNYATDLENAIKRRGVEQVLIDHFKTMEIKDYDLKNEISLINTIYKSIYSDEVAAFSAIMSFYFMQRLLQKKIEPLNYERLNEVYRQYVTKPYPLNMK